MQATSSFTRMIQSLSQTGEKHAHNASKALLVFAAAPAVSASRALHVRVVSLTAASPLVGAFFGAGIRARSGSLAVSVVAHNISNAAVMIGTAFL